MPGCRDGFRRTRPHSQDYCPVCRRAGSPSSASSPTMPASRRPPTPRRPGHEPVRASRVTRMSARPSKPISLGRLSWKREPAPASPPPWSTGIMSMVEDTADPVALRDVAAITFTERAGGELRDKVRDALVKRAADSSNDRVQQALLDVDVAVIGTIHSFALTILREHVVAAGLPLGFEVVNSSGASHRAVSADRRGLGKEPARRRPPTPQSGWDLPRPVAGAGRGTRRGEIEDRPVDDLATGADRRRRSGTRGRVGPQ